MRVIGIATMVAATALAAAQAAQADPRPRPTDVAPGNAVTEVAPNALQVFNDYAAPERAYASERAVVHYVVLGIDAPPLNDDDGDGVPDYVERVGDAADTAVAYFQRRGFAPILADSGGPDARPDVYISRFTPGYLGVSFPAAETRDGAFVAVSNELDPSAERSFCSLYGTVAHELFHLVQFSYFPPADDPAIPAWALEGSAAAMEGRVYPELSDLVTSLQLRRWFAATQRSLTTQTYGAQLLWSYLDAREPRLLPAYLARLAAPTPPRSATAALAATYARLAGSSFAATFERFAVQSLADHASEITPLRTLARGSRTAGRVAPLAIHYLRLSRATRSVTLRVKGASPELVYQLESEQAGEPAVTSRLPAQRVDGALVFSFPPALRRSDRFSLPTLVIANGDASRTAAYAVAVR